MQTIWLLKTVCFCTIMEKTADEGRGKCIGLIYVILPYFPERVNKKTASEEELNA